MRPEQTYNDFTLMSDTALAPTHLPPWLANQRDALLAQRGHAWLLAGPSGLGQYALALSLVQAWLCEAQPEPGAISGSASDGEMFADSVAPASDAPASNADNFQPACGVCASCQMLASRAHPDVAVLMPETLMLELGWPLPEKAQKEIDDKKRKPSKEIRVDAMRDVIEFTQLTSGRGRGLAVLVYPAERMNHITANALLKTLEEPNGKLKFVLATEAAHQLLPTIRSRCQTFALHWPQAHDTTEWLQAQAPEKTSPALLEAALLCAGGRPFDALAALQDGTAAVWARLPHAVANGHTAAFADLSVQASLGVMQKLCHDLWALKLGATPRFFAATDLPKPPPARALSAWSEQLKKLALSIDHTWKAELLLEDLLSQARLALVARS